MSVKLLAIGNTSFGFIKEGVGEYQKRINRYFKFEIIELPDVKNRGKLSLPELKKQEMALIEKNLKSFDKLILLDEKGNSFDSMGFARFLQDRLANKTGNLVFVVGGMFGFDEALRLKAHHILSMSPMTMSHQIVRLFFAEQLYRACTILKGEPYHNEG